MAYEIRQLEKWRQQVVEYGKSDKSERLQQVDSSLLPNTETSPNSKNM